MSKRIAVLGIDLGKNSCSVAGLDDGGVVVLPRRLRREGVIPDPADRFDRTDRPSLDTRTVSALITRIPYDSLATGEPGGRGKTLSARPAEAWGLRPTAA
jgi:hypothetical protein